jgi:16S rRNA processing protein RimM
VSEIARGPGGELLVLKLADGTEGLVPFVREIVPEVDVAGGRVVLDPPEGLL